MILGDGLPIGWSVARYRFAGGGQAPANLAVAPPRRRMNYARAIDDESGDVVLIKWTRPSVIGPKGVDSFLTEGRAVARLQHDGILRCKDVGVAGDVAFHAYDLEEFRTLEEALPARAPLAPTLVVVECLARALAFLHARGLSHGLVHTGNVFVAPSLQSKLTGFSLGWEGTPAVSPAFSPPEHVVTRIFGQAGVVDEARADVYMWAATLWTLLVGETWITAPSTRIDAAALSLFHQSPPPADLALHRDDVPRWLRRLVQRCLDKDPKNRPRDASEIVDELEGRVEPPGTAPMRKALAALSSSSTSSWARPLPAIVSDLATLRSPALATLRLLDLAEAATKLLATTSLALAQQTSTLPLRPSLGHWCAALRAHHAALPGGVHKRVLRALDDAVAVRNSVRGHGALSDEASYLAILEEQAPALLHALGDARVLSAIDVGEAGVAVEGVVVDCGALFALADCDVCGAREPLFFNAGDDKRSTWLSYETGHLSQKKKHNPG